MNQRGDRVFDELVFLCTLQAAVKEERREARASKKALKILYKDESQRAQHGAANTGPSGIHLP